MPGNDSLFSDQESAPQVENTFVECRTHLCMERLFVIR